MKKNIAVIFGGKSAEHDVSIITAHLPVIKSLLITEEYEVYPVYIDKDGSWYSDPAMNELKYFQQVNFREDLPKRKVKILFDNGLHLIFPGFRESVIKIDIVFPTMHGTYGEDGSLMGLLRMAGVPFVGCDLFASALAMDKASTKQVLSSQGIPVVPYIWFTRAMWEAERENLRKSIAELRKPLFVKPVHLGSSIGITKINNDTQLENAIEVAFHYDDKILVEEGIEDLTEVTLPILGNDVLSLGSIERPLNKTEFFDFSDKYLSGGKKLGGVNNRYSEIPADIPESIAEKVRTLGRETYKVLGLSGIARIDFLIGKMTDIYVNEVNTMPGGLYDHNWRKSGLSNVALVRKLVALAEEKFAKEGKITYTFESDILKKVSGQKFSA